MDDRVPIRSAFVRPSTSLLLTVTGRDRPGIASWFFAALDELRLPVLDVEQIQVHGKLLLCVESRAPVAAVESIRAELGRRVASGGAATSGEHLTTTVESLEPLARTPDGNVKHLVTILAPELEASTMSGVFAHVAAGGANVDRIVQLSRYPVTSYELVVSGGDPDRLRRELGREAARLQVDVAVQRAGLNRRAKHLIVLDVDSTLVRGEVIDALAARAGCEEEVTAVTAAAMAGELDFGTALRRRVSLLAGLPAEALEAVRRELVLTPGARTLIRSLRRLGYVTAVVSGGFEQVIGGLAAELGIDHVAANSLEVRDGRLTGRIRGPVVDREGKADALVRFAALAGVPLSRTVAIGDGANDLDMLAVAGLGIAFNAKPVLRDAADTALNVPYLDAILFLLGISREEIEAADRDADAEGG